MIIDKPIKKRGRGRPPGSKNKKSGNFVNGRKTYTKKTPEEKLKYDLVKFTKKQHHDLEWFWKIKELMKKYKFTNFNKVLADNDKILKFNCNVEFLDYLNKWKSNPENKIFEFEIISIKTIWKGNSVENFLYRNNINTSDLQKPLKNIIKFDNDLFLFRIKVGNDDDYDYVYILSNDAKKLKKPLNLRKMWKNNKG